MKDKGKLVVLIGPTAVGKTKLSIELAKKLGGEIISGDSMQVYRGMDIGTAKIQKEEMDGIPHHLIDIKDPTDSFSVAEFQLIVRERIDEIHRRGCLPMIVGGTGLYIQSVIYDYQFTENTSDPEYSDSLEAIAATEGVLAVHNMLREIDPESADRIHPNNIRRVIRALEIFRSSGLTMGQYQEKQETELVYDTVLIGLTMERDILYDRINLRVDHMIDNGLLEEVSALYNKGVKECQSIQAIGYKEIYEYLDGKISLAEATQQLKQNSRRYAKRQLTWFRNKMNVRWFDMTEANQGRFNQMLDEILKYIAGKLKI